MKVMRLAVLNQRWDLAAHALLIGLLQAERLCSLGQGMGRGAALSSPAGGDVEQAALSSVKETSGRIKIGSR